MPARIRIAIEHPKPETVVGTHLHALVSKWIDNDHKATKKPFSIVPLHEGPTGKPTFEIGVLADELLPTIESALANFAQTGGRLARDRCELAAKPEMVAYHSWADMWERANSHPTIKVSFETPVTFRVGQLANPVPLPSSVFRSWLRRWRDFAPSDLARLVEVNAADEQVLISHLAGETVKAKTPRRSITGFVGVVHFHNFTSGVDGTVLSKQLNALAAIAPFGGTGTSTTSGLGVTVLLGSQ